MANDLDNKVQLAAEDVRRLCGELQDWKVSAIIASGASLSELELALARLTGADEMTRDHPRPLDGAAAVVYDLLASDEDFLSEDASGPAGG